MKSDHQSKSEPPIVLDSSEEVPGATAAQSLSEIIDPEATLAKKGAGKEARLCYSANALMENRNTLLLDFQVEPADGRAERRSTSALKALSCGSL